jgi:hypothetical protein
MTRDEAFKKAWEELPAVSRRAKVNFKFGFNAAWDAALLEAAKVMCGRCKDLKPVVRNDEGDFVHRSDLRNDFVCHADLIHGLREGKDK